MPANVWNNVQFIDYSTGQLLSRYCITFLSKVTVWYICIAMGLRHVEWT